MKIRIYGKRYNVNKKLAASSKRTIQQILEKVRLESDLRGISEYYVAFVVMMYVISSSILHEMTTLTLKGITDGEDTGKMDRP